MRTKMLFLLGIILLCMGCSETPQQKIDGEVYKVDLDKMVNPFDEIFSKAEIIPLETVDSSFISWMRKIYPIDENLYVYDYWLQNLNVFDHKGNFIRRVGKRGQGPGEYRNMYDCYIDAADEKTYLLDVNGYIKQYHTDGTFECDIFLPVRPHYYSMSLLDEKHLVTWSCVNAEDGGGILIIDKETGDSIQSCWYDEVMFNIQQMFPFYRYADKTFFSTALRQQTYELTPKGLQPAYSWDFGKYNISKSTLEHYLAIEDVNERNESILNDCGTDRLPFHLQIQRQNERYAYLALKRYAMSSRAPYTYVFYDKRQGKGYAFDELADGCRMNAPLYFGEDYMLTDVVYEEREQYQSVLPESEYKKLEDMKEDDNPCLLKLYFK